MSGDRIDGAAKKAAGAIKEGTGKVLGDREMEAKGAAQKAAGAVENKVGKARGSRRQRDQALVQTAKNKPASP